MAALESILDRLAERDEQHDRTIRDLGHNLTRISATLDRIVDNQAKFDTVLSVLAEAQIKHEEQMAALEKQWQAYLNTLRPQ